MGIQCQIHIETPPTGVFRPGSTVTGTVKYIISKDTMFSDITLSLKGRGKCEWTNTERRPHGNVPQQYKFYGAENYVEMHKSVSVNANGIVGTGEYTFPFQFVLPYNIPPSFKDKTFQYESSIIYFVRIKFTEAGVFNIAKRFRSLITVGSCVMPTLQPGPIIYAQKKTLTKYFSSKKSEINIKVIIAKSILTPSESAELTIEVENDTDIVIPKIKVRLEKIVKLQSDGGRGIIYETIIKGYKAKTDSVDKRSTTNLVTTVKTPEDAFTLQFSRIISMEYRLRLMVKVPGFHRNAAVTIPIILGEVMIQNMAGHSMYALPPYVPPPDDSPPTYWEAMEEEK